MGFVYDLHCDSCGIVEHHIIIGLDGGSTLSLIQDRESGVIRQIAVTNSEIARHSGNTDFASDDEWLAAMDSFVESQTSESERQIAPHEAFCPKCRTPFRVVSAGIS